MLRTAIFKKSRIHFNDTGKGRVIVLLHGFLGSRKVWDDYEKELSKKFRIIAIDLPGHGKTPSIGYYHSMELMAQSVKAVLDKVKVRRYVMIGHSMGGYVSLAFAELFPENIAGLSLCHSTSFTDKESKKKDRGKLIELIKKGNKKLISDSVQMLFTPDKIKRNKKKMELAIKTAQSTSKQSIINSLEGMKERKCRDLILKFSDYPILFIIGKKDTVTDENSMYSQIGLCKFPEIAMMDDYGHMGFYEEPDMIIPEITGFALRCFRKNY
jgi:pimeloyl-ACP methyl ester carboxylesterase